MYKILGADHREYGPVTKEQLVAWIAEGRANAATPVQADGTTEWKPLSSFPEFEEALKGTIPPPVTAGPTSGFYPDQLLAGDYRLDVGSLVGRAFDLVKRDFSTLFGVTAIWLVIQFGIGLFSAIPFVGSVFSLASLIVQGPLMAGLYLVYLRRIRGQPADAGELFAGFGSRMGQYILALVIPALLVFVACLPGIVLTISGVFMIHRDMVPVGVLFILPGVLLIFLPSLYLGICWKFTMPLVADKKMEFWPAMQLSRGMAMKHFWTLLGLFILTAVINVVGVMLCLVGLFVSIPMALAMTMLAFETIFGGAQPASAPANPSPV